MLLSACGGGGGSSGGGGGGGGGVTPPPTSVTVSGRIAFERVPFQSPGSENASAGLDYPQTFVAPAREVVVELLDGSSQAVLATTATDGDGRYAFTTTSNRSVIVRAKALTQRAAPGWDLRVLNNTNGNALYVLDSSAFNTGTADSTRNLTAETGWPDFNGNNYVGTRAAAPFAILDTLYASAQFARTGSATVHLPPLAAYWSPQNRSSANFDPPSGAVQSTLYQSVADGGPIGIYVLGLAGNDTDEFDQHVIAHEFQHFLEDRLSRTDTIGGPHGPGDRLDLRLAFSEGFANAFSAMVLNDPVYKDSLGAVQGSRFDFDVENTVPAPQGWFNEDSVQSLVWDLYDTASDGVDAVSIGYAPLHDVQVATLRTSPALTSIFPFLDALRARAGAPVAGIDALAQSQSVTGTGPYADGETNSGGIAQALPVYTPLVPNAGDVTVCGTAAAGTYNALGNRRFLRFSLAGARTATVRAVYTSAGSAVGGPTPDPDIVLHRNGYLAAGDAAAANVETLTLALEAGDYVVEVYEYSHVDPSTNASRRGVTCMNVSVSG